MFLRRYILDKGIIAYEVRKRFMSAWLYRIGHTLIDSGPPAVAKKLVPFILQDGEVDDIFISHHHEDHSGGVRTLQKALGVQVHVSQYAVPLTRSGFGLILINALSGENLSLLKKIAF
ncbi:MAG: MBL fold metallo-hydrolase [Deinococcales bacterium]